MRITVVGTGYVGLVAGACFADTGNRVVCLDKDESKVERLRRGEVPIFEPGLEEIVRRGQREGRLSFTSDVAEAVAGAEVLFLAVGTPASSTGEPDLSFLESAARSVAKRLDGPVLVVNKSTVPVGAHQVVERWMKQETSFDISVVSNPVFLREGCAVMDFLKPDRVVVGTDRRDVFEKMAALYAPFVSSPEQIVRMDPVSAELTKYACNAFLATRISFMNELAILCEKVGGDVEKIRVGMSLDHRIGRHFLHAGAGYGGSCFPKDTAALVATAKRSETPLRIVEAAQVANAYQREWILKKIDRLLSGKISGSAIAVWGLAFKPNTDDIRDAPALAIIEELVGLGASVRAFDPAAMEASSAWLKSKLGKKAESIQCTKGPLEALEGADLLLVVTEWNEFRQVDLNEVRRLRGARLQTL